ncbi:MAG: hypothetical protein ACLQQ4_02380 [Bacteroidia bacterium]
MRTKATLPYNLVISALLTVLFFFATHKVYHLPFSYGDDHRVLGIMHPEKVSQSYKTALYGFTPDLKGCFGIDAHIGRFRPLSWSYNKLLCIICGDNTHLYRLSNFIILFLSAFFLLAIFSCFEVDRLSALIVLAVYVFGRNNETWWTLIPPPQNIGEMFLLAGIYCWLRYRKKGRTGFYILPALLFLLAGISKESFIFCIPVLLLTDYFFFNQAKRFFSKEYLLSVLASFLPFACLLGTVIYINKVYAYPYNESILSIAAYNTFQFMGGAIFFLAPLTLLFIRRKSIETRLVLKVLAVFTIWGVLQLVLLKGIKLNDQHHYLIPWLIYPFILTAIALSEIRKSSGKWYMALLIAYGLATLIFAKNTYANSSSYSASLQAYYNMLDTIKKDTSAPEVVYLTDNACMQDWISGTRVIMDTKGINKELYFTTIASSVPAWQKSFAEHSPQQSFKRMSVDSAFFPDGKWIILVEDPSKNGIVNDSIVFYKRADSSFVKLNGKERFIQGRYYYFSVPYPGRSIGDMLKGNFNAENRKGFYGIKLNDYRELYKMLRVPHYDGGC